MVDILITILVLLVIFIVIRYAIVTFLPLDAPTQNMVLLVLGLIFVIWLLLALTGSVPMVAPWRSR